MNIDWIHALLGGVLIGSAASLLLFWTGRVAGISGIAYGLFNVDKKDFGWRVAFLVGLVAGGLVLNFVSPQVFEGGPEISGLSVVVAGLLVGFGSVLGSGCTSGHGVCGISRLSVRSLLATTLFIGAGICAVFVFRKLGIFE